MIMLDPVDDLIFTIALNVFLCSAFMLNLTMYRWMTRKEKP